MGQLVRVGTLNFQVIGVYNAEGALGGADDIHNLWPQPYSDTLWNAEVKDALEDRLREMVCDGSLDLTEAQQEIAVNWIAGQSWRVRFSSQALRARNTGAPSWSSASRWKRPTGSRASSRS